MLARLGDKSRVGAEILGVRIQDGSNDVEGGRKLSGAAGLGPSGCCCPSSIKARRLRKQPGDAVGGQVLKVRCNRTQREAHVHAWLGKLFWTCALLSLKGLPHVGLLIQVDF